MGADSQLKKCTGFDWDRGNSEKNWIKHKVRRDEAEQIFFNQPLIVADDDKHSTKETRYLALGKTSNDRLLTVVFAIRKKTLIRVISARDMHKNERKIYEK